jgi:broad specificity phosphatase PhoE
MVLKNLLEHEKGKTFVFLVRHGHFDIPEEPHAYNPHLPLSKRGIKQAKDVAKQFSKIKDQIDIFYASSMKRAKQTAKEIEKSINKKPKLSDKLWEFNKIRWTRKYYHYKFWKHWLKHRQRINEFNRILKENEGKVILIVAHGNLIKGILHDKMKLTSKHVEYQNYRNCYISLLRFNKTKLEFVHYFNSKHLDTLR